MKSSEEKWLPISGWVGSYDVSNLGRVRSLARLIRRKDGSSVMVRERVLRHSVNLDGRLIVTLQRQVAGRAYRRKPLVHRLVAMAFIPNPHNKPEVNHEDGNCSHNWSTNLTWATARENKDHAADHHLNDGNPIRNVVRCIETGMTKLGIAEMSAYVRSLGLKSTPSGMNKHLRQRGSYHAGLRFRYIEADELSGMKPRDFLDRLGIP